MATRTAFGHPMNITPKRKVKVFAPEGNPAGAGAAGPPAVPTPPVPDVSYKDSDYYNTDSQISQGLANLRPYLINQANTLGLDYGVNTGGADPSAYDPAHPTQFGVDWTNVDTTNPFSRAALLKKSYTQTSRGDANRMAAAGQLYSGAYQNAQNADTSNYQQGQNALLTDFAARFGGLYGQWQSAQANATGQQIANTGNAIERHINDQAPTPKPKAVVKKPVMTAFGHPMFRR